MSNKEYKVLIIFLTILIHFTPYKGQNQSYYPKGNQYHYGVSMFNGSTMYMTVNINFLIILTFSSFTLLAQVSQ